MMRSLFLGLNLKDLATFFNSAVATDARQLINHRNKLHDDSQSVSDRDEHQN